MYGKKIIYGVLLNLPFEMSFFGEGKKMMMGLKSSLSESASHTHKKSLIFGNRKIL